MDAETARANDNELPVGLSDGLTYFTAGVLAAAGRYRHEDTHAVHSHSFVEIVIVLGGHGVHHTMLSRHPLETGDVLVLRPGAWHGYEECRDLRIINLCFSAELLQRELSWTRQDALLAYLLWDGPYSPKQHGTLTFRLGQAELEECTAHLDALHALGAEALEPHRGDVIGRLALVLGHLARAAAAGREKPEALAGPSARPAAVRAIRLLEARISHDWTLSELASLMHLAPSHLARVFKSATGLPPMAYLARYRLETAAVLLLNTDQSVAQIGVAVGLPDQNYFARRFKTHFGLSATTYRSRGVRPLATLRPPDENQPSPGTTLTPVPGQAYAAAPTAAFHTQDAQFRPS
jgi:AraC family transcriptional regulator, L-rhamnose operon transcriptional activator RhaR